MRSTTKEAANDARQHIAAHATACLHAAGSYKALAKQTGMTESTLVALVHGSPYHCQSKREGKLSADVVLAFLYKTGALVGLRSGK